MKQRDDVGAVTIFLRDAQSGHQALSRLWLEFVKPMTMAGHQLYLTAGVAEDMRSVAQNRYYWGVVLKCVAEQVKIEGQLWEAEAWHNLFKRKFLGYAITKEKIAGRKRKVVRRTLRSTTGLSVRKMSLYLERVMAYAVSDLGVTFDSDWWE
jgi:hypothetical protein